MRDQGRVAGRTPRWQGGDLGCTGGLAGAAKTPPVASRRGGRSRIHQHRNQHSRELMCVLGVGAGCVSPLSLCPPSLPPLLSHPSTRSVKPPGFCPAGNSRFFAGFFHLTQSQGSKSSCVQGWEAGPSLGWGSNTQKKEVYLFSLPKQSSGVGGEALDSPEPAHVGAHPGGVGSHGWLRAQRGDRVDTMPPAPHAPSAPWPTIAAFRHSPACFPVYPQPVLECGAPTAPGDPTRLWVLVARRGVGTGDSRGLTISGSW